MDPLPPLLPHENNISTPTAPLLSHEQPLTSNHPRLIKSTTAKEEVINLSDSEDESKDLVAPAIAIEPSQRERELMVARRALRKWWRLAGLNRRRGHELGFEKGEELGVAWTKGICPRVEGRIKIIGEVAVTY